MTKTHRTIATDSETALHQTIGDDATATFENDPTFVASNPGTDGSSANIAEQRDTDDSDEEILDDDDAEEEEDDEEQEDDEVEAAAAANR
jgi:hypothetical protein